MPGKEGGEMGWGVVVWGSPVETVKCHCAAQQATCRLAHTGQGKLQCRSMKLALASKPSPDPRCSACAPFGSPTESQAEQRQGEDVPLLVPIAVHASHQQRGHRQ